MNKSLVTIAWQNALSAVAVRISLGLFVVAALLPGRVHASEMTNHILLPMIQSSQDAVARSSNDSADCELNTQEQQLAAIMRSASGQQRAALNCHAALNMVAQAMAQDMATRDYFNAINPEGQGPNYLAAQAGYTLPNYYHQAVNANNIAYVAAGHATAQAMWDNTAGVPQLLGDNEFYAKQTDFGIGYVMASEASVYRYYWVLLTAEPNK